jgi:hypothetical protein
MLPPLSQLKESFRFLVIGNKSSKNMAPMMAPIPSILLENYCG